MRLLPRVHESDSAVELVERWSRAVFHALLVVDQFEELFTLNAEETQASFASLLARLPLEADVHVLLSMRDDFLMLCNRHEGLRPVVHGLTLLDPPAGAALRRALTQPALQCGYRFEDDALVDEMLGEVEGERGALPLLAFAAARLWEKRDRGAGLLTRQAYHDIGGVGGALARHAEATMDRVGSERIGIVRELFRNLVTAEKTRAVREWDELLSVFDDSQRASAAEVLRQLIDARLLTSYEVKEEERGPTRRVEIIHESLLANWPRLVRWQTQDADAAQLRDQLRQAARTWEEHGRTDDMLWSGSAYREYTVWRERYPGGLTGLEEAFAAAMTSLATRRRRRRRIAVTAGIAVLLVVLAVVGTLWRRSVQETRHAEAEAAQREAAQLLALGQANLVDSPHAALAYAIASLERADNDPARRFAVEALWQGPPGLYFADLGPASVAWSRDARWLALGGAGVVLLNRETGEQRQLSSAAATIIGFTSDDRFLVTLPGEYSAKALHIWALPDGRPDRTLELEEESAATLADGFVLTWGEDSSPPRQEVSYVVRRIALDGSTQELLGRWESHDGANWDIDPSATWIVSVQHGRLLQQRLDDLSAPGRQVGTHEGGAMVRVRPWGDRAVTGDSTGEVRIWDVPSARLERTLKSPADARRIALDPKERFLATGVPEGVMDPRWLVLFDLAAPRSAEPLPLIGNEISYLLGMQFSPDGSWLASGHGNAAVLRPLTGPRSIVIGRQESFLATVAFTRDEHLLSVSWDGVLRRWPLDPAAGDGVRELWSEPGVSRISVFTTLESNPGGRSVAMSVGYAWGRIVVVPLDGSKVSDFQLMKSPESSLLVSLTPVWDPTGRFLAVSVYVPGQPRLNAIRILDLENGGERTLDTHPTGEDRCEEPGSENWGFAVPVWLPDGRLVSDGDGGLRVWDLAAGTSRLLRPCRKISPSGNPLLATPDSRMILRLALAVRVGEVSALSAFDLATGETREITSHGTGLRSFALDASGTILVTGDKDGVVRVGPLSGEEPHLLFGHTQPVTSVAVSPDGRWIASGSDDRTIRLWPMPDLSKPPLHTLPHDEVLAKLKSLTNLRAVRDPASDTGWKIEIGPFPGWAEVPTWSP